MNMNLLSLNLFQPSPIEIITEKIVEILRKFPQNNNIQIQFKYAQFICFSQSYFDRDQQLRKKAHQKCGAFVVQQNRLHFETLKKLSNHQLILLNMLTRRVYTLYGGFDQRVHKKFYKIRQFLINLCKQNQQNLINNHNFYFDIQKLFMNKTFKILNKSQIRFDINIKQGQEAGRYSYQVGKGWTKTNKQNLIREEFDLMMVQKTFRLAIKKQQEVVVSSQQVLNAINTPSVAKGAFFLRFKRALRVTKNDEVQIALSEVYQPQAERRNQLLQDVKDILGLETNFLDDFCRNVFQQFYMWQPKPNQYSSFSQLVNKFEIESQYLPAGLKKIQKLHKQQNYKQLFRYVQTTLYDLYVLSFVDHNVKKRQSTVIPEVIKSKNGEQSNYPECRLQNEYGSYMHDLVYQFMTAD